ncbi:7463_t:CDS:1 [Scutellospora calospora]|uniref:7463_t:CDS:1 n=1 Tax=Scutellospora calospora TaxID=85575 RepID=A0ACA9KZR8_9GLOM|nr:7463_t:CDS:1 [Scutellospora calospora]
MNLEVRVQNLVAQTQTQESRQSMNLEVRVQNLVAQTQTLEGRQSMNLEVRVQNLVTQTQTQEGRQNMNLEIRVQNLVAQTQTQEGRQRIFNSNLDFHAKNLIRAYRRKPIKGFNLLRMIINNEGLQINETNGCVISQSVRRIWGNFTPAEKSIFKNFASRIQEIVNIGKF